MAIERIRLITPILLASLREDLEGGVKVAEIAAKWEVGGRAVYYWIHKEGIPLRKIKKELAEKRKKRPRAKFTYHFYLNRAMKRGAITPRQKQEALNKFYQNRDNALQVATLDYSSNRT